MKVVLDKMYVEAVPEEDLGRSMIYSAPLNLSSQELW